MNAPTFAVTIFATLFAVLTLVSVAGQSARGCCGR
jgi:hypothetical protein